MGTVILRAGELGALRLADLEGLHQETCAQRMDISRTTLSRTLAQARRKVTDALLNGKRLLVALSPDSGQSSSRRAVADEPGLEQETED